MIFPPALGQFGLLKHDSGLADGQATISAKAASLRYWYSASIADFFVSSPESYAGELAARMIALLL